MNAVAALLFAAFFALAASDGTPDAMKIIYRFSSREFALMPESRRFNGSEFIQPKPYDPERETIVYFHGSNLIDPETIYTQEYFMSTGFLKQYDCNILVVFWDLLIGKGATQEETYKNAEFVGSNTAELLKYIKNTYGGTTIRAFGYDYGAVAAATLIQAVKGVLPVLYFTVFNPINPLPGNDTLNHDILMAYHVIYSWGEPMVKGHRNFFINDGQTQENCPTEPKIVSEFCQSNQAFLYLTLSLHSESNTDYEVTYCPSWEEYVANNCTENPKAQLYSDKAKSALPVGNYYGKFITIFEPAFEPYWAHSYWKF